VPSFGTEILWRFRFQNTHHKKEKSENKKKKKARDKINVHKTQPRITGHNGCVF
jgi:hypothetical protein